MAAVPQLTSPAHAVSAGPVHPTSQLVQDLPGFDPAPVINAHEASLADYLNQPVHDILARLGLSPVPTAAPQPAPSNAAAGAANPNAVPPPIASSTAAPGSAASPFDPTSLIQPVTDALGTLGSGQFGNLDPTQMFGGLAQTLESAGQSVQQAMSGLGSGWQGTAATAAGAKTNAALQSGGEVANQATGLRASVSAAAAAVAQAQARLIEIINEFMAKLAAIGPNIVFPWGIAAAIEAANEAVTSTTEVMTELQSSLAGESAHATSVGTPVAVTSGPQFGMNAAAASVPVGAAAAPLSAAAAPALGQAIGPLLQVATSVASPVMDGVSAVTQAVQTNAKTGATASGTAAGSSADQEHQPGGAGGGGAGKKPSFGGTGAGGGPVLAAQSRLGARPSAAITTSIAGTHDGAAIAASGAMGGMPMMGGAPMSGGTKASAGSRHNAAAFLHTSDQGDEIAGDLGSVAPPVIGQLDANEAPDVDLRI
jgi:hypothetical protein